ncbi:ExeA family protein [Jannaschia ovalis]|uniref:AAA family ATPase n=1 Tax=Jannaschia ovalis TaxID=3038773 RepID=A0ABY8L7B9_9RHOB|nr:AAA family ATPase [Jannaschia sp. GRR-S6-38]WGH77274.1 AAA family ATPase [Jannaschia sp. GRR-S6-38]
MADVEDLYRAQYGMDGRPFGVLADAELSYCGPGVVRAHAALEYGLMTGAPFIVLTGDAGTGKTSLLLRIMADADPAQRVVLMSGLRQGTGSVLPWVLQALGEDIAADAAPTELFTRLQDALIAEYAAGRRMVLVVDEAQSLSTAALDELRILSNINTAADQLLQVVLSGHSLLRDRLRAPELLGLAQRVGVWAALPPLSRAALADYVAARLAAVGGAEDLFEPAALSLIHSVTSGLPRSVNQLCEMTMIFALSETAPTIGAALVQQVLEQDMFLAPLAAAPDRPSGPATRPGRLRLASGA